MGVAERKIREKESRSQQIINSALTLFREKGFDKTTMIEIAAHAELSKGTLYIYFKSKQELIFKILEPVLLEFDQKLKQLALKSIEPADKTLMSILDSLYELHIKKPEATQMLTHFKAREFKKLLNEEEFNKIAGLMNENLKALQTVIQRGIDQGIFIKCNPLVTSIIFWNTVMGVILYQENRVYDGKNDYIKPTLDEAIRLLIKGMKH